MKTSRFAVLLLAAGLVLSGCSSDQDKKKTDAVPVPKGFDVPQGVTLTKGGTTRAVGKPASVIYQVDATATSAVTVTVAQVKRGAISDFRFFSLDAETKKSSPYYVTVSVKNEGPAGLGGSALPIFAHDSSNTNIPANDIIGTFKPCPTSTLPKSFLPGATARVCLVYLIPKGRKLQTIDLQTGSSQDAIAWKP